MKCTEASDQGDGSTASTVSENWMTNGTHDFRKMSKNGDTSMNNGLSPRESSNELMLPRENIQGEDQAVDNPVDLNQLCQEPYKLFENSNGLTTHIDDDQAVEIPGDSHPTDKRSDDSSPEKQWLMVNAEEGDVKDQVVEIPIDPHSTHKDEDILGADKASSSAIRDPEDQAVDIPVDSHPTNGVPDESSSKIHGLTMSSIEVDAESQVVEIPIDSHLTHDDVRTSEAGKMFSSEIGDPEDQAVDIPIDSHPTHDERIFEAKGIFNSEIGDPENHDVEILDPSHPTYKEIDKSLEANELLISDIRDCKGQAVDIPGDSYPTHRNKKITDETEKLMNKNVEYDGQIANNTIDENLVGDIRMDISLRSFEPLTKQSEVTIGSKPNTYKVEEKSVTQRRVELSETLQSLIAYYFSVIFGIYELLLVTFCISTPQKFVLSNRDENEIWDVWDHDDPLKSRVLEKKQRKPKLKLTMELIPW